MFHVEHFLFLHETKGAIDALLLKE